MMGDKEDSSDNIIGSGISSLLQQQVYIAHRLQSVIPQDIFNLTKTISSFQKPVSAIGLGNLHKFAEIGTSVARISRYFHDHPNSIKNSVVKAAHSGWFLDLEISISDLHRISQFFEEDNLDAVDQWAIGEYEPRIEEIKHYLSSHLPHRNTFIKSVFDAHSEAKYDLSVLAALSQADGVCRERLGENFFLRNRSDGKPKTSMSLKVQDTLKNENDIMAWYMIALATEGLPIHMSEAERKAQSESVSFNRHSIMHGENLDYSNKTNSLKAISLLNYVCQMTEEEQEE